MPLNDFFYGMTVSIAAALILGSSVVYGIQAYKGTIKPVSTTWILMTVFLGLSLLMYWHSPKKSMTGNVSLTAGFAGILLVLAGVVWGQLKRKEFFVSFNRFQIFCLILSAIVLGIWFFTEDHFWSYVLMQGVALIAYSATVQKLWNAKGVKEPMYIWASVLFAVIIALYPSFVKMDAYAWVYAIRAIPSTLGVIWLIQRANKRENLLKTEA